MSYRKKLLPNQRSWRLTSKFSSKSFIVLSLKFRSLIHFELIFERCKIRVQLYSFACGYSVFPAPFFEDTILSPLCDLGIFRKDHLTVYTRVYIWYLSFVTLAFMPVQLCYFDAVPFLYGNSERLMSCVSATSISIFSQIFSFYRYENYVFYFQPCN